MPTRSAPERPEQRSPEFDEERTDLPPPAPGLVSPLSGQQFDPPTLPGIVAPHRAAPPLSGPVAEHELPLQIRGDAVVLPTLPSESGAPGSGVAEPIEWVEHTLRMPAVGPASSASHLPPLGPLHVSPPQSPPSTGPFERLALPPIPIPSGPRSETLRMPLVAPRQSGEHDTTPRPLLPPSASSPSISGAITAVTALSDAAAQQLASLLPLPPAPLSGSPVAAVRYYLTVSRGLRLRKKLATTVEQSLETELGSVDRARTQLGQRAYADQIDLPALRPDLVADEEAHNPRRAEVWAARLEAEHAQLQSDLGRDEAQLLSELRARSQARRARQISLLHTPRGPLADEAELSVVELTRDLDVLAQHLGQLRAERLMRERAHRLLFQSPEGRDQLHVALDAGLRARGGRPPHLLVLGALASLHRVPLGYASPDRAAHYAALYHPLELHQARLASRLALLARLEADRVGYDRDALAHGRRLALISVGGLLGVLVALALLLR